MKYLIASIMSIFAVTSFAADPAKKPEPAKAEAKKDEKKEAQKK